MARRENQGYQIAVVSLLILWIMTTVGMFVFFNKYKTVFAQSEKDKADNQNSQQALRTAGEDIDKLKQWVGFEQSTSTAEIEKAAGADWERFAATLPQAQRNYRAALEQTAASLGDAQNNLRVSHEEVQSLKDRNEAREAAKDKQIAEHRAELDKTRTELADMRSKYDEARAGLEQQRDAAQQESQKTKTLLTSTQQEFDQHVSKSKQDVNFKNQEIKKRNEQIAELRGETPGVADGRIRKIDQHTGVVWINVGQADALRRQVTFSVYGLDNNGVARAKRKGAIEVTRVLGPHLAEARILEDKTDDPLVTGDEIYSPLWQPGRPERFALAGFFDIDGDDHSDRQIIQELVSMNGGIIDAELDDQGNETGAMTIETRFLVVGDENENIVSKLGAIKARAQELGVEVLPMSKFLDHIGWKNTNKVLRFGSDQHRDFTAPIPDGGVRTSSGITTDHFRKRYPREAETKHPTASAFDDAGSK